MKKIIALVLAVVIASFALVACGGGKIVSKNITVRFIDGNGQNIGETVLEVVEGVNGESPTVLQAAEQALIYLDFDTGYEKTADGHSIKAVKGIVEQDETDATTGYYQYWKATVNGQDSTKGRQDITPIYNDDVIVYEYVSDSKPREDVTEAPETEAVSELEWETEAESETEE